MWIGGQTAGQGHAEPYGSFWYSGHRILAHRWSCEHIHGLDPTNLQVDHYCPAGPSTLCVEHVRPESPEMNRYLQTIRPGRAFQSLETKRYWVHVQVGIEPKPERLRIEGFDVPIFLPPQWLRPYLPKLEVSDGCPF